MNSFIYNIPTKVYFGQNQLAHLGEELKKFGKRVLLVYGGGSIKKTGLYDRVKSVVSAAGLELHEHGGIEPNPRVASVNRGADICKREKIDVLLAVGGGSTLDATKFIGAGACYDGDAWDLITDRADIKACLPIVTVLTLSATGSEMDTGGVITNPDTNDKIGKLHPLLLPKVSFLDPTETYTVNRYQTACGSADILSHLFEVYFNTEPDLYMLDCFMEGLMKTVIKYTPVALETPDDYEARANLMWASTWAINGFVNGGKQQEWTCHPIEHELSAFYDITHGLGLAIVTLRWMEYTLNDNTVSKFVQFGVNVFGLDGTKDPYEIARAAIARLKEFFFTTCGLTDTLTKLNIDATHFPLMANKVCANGTLDNFQSLKAIDVENILKACLV